MSKTIEANDAVMETPGEVSGSSLWQMMVCAVAFVVCILLMMTPIMRMGHLYQLTDFSLPRHLSPPTLPFLTLWSSWLPGQLHLSSDPTMAIYRTGNVEVLLLVVLSCVVYGAALYICWRRIHDGQMKFVRTAIWIATIVAGLLFVLTPGMASKDLFVYADYGNMVGQHAANPYFSVPGTVAHGDLMTALDGWSNVPSAYGPVWVLLTGFLSWIFAQHALAFYYAYRLLGLVCHLINIWLIVQILRISGRSERTITFGMLLYAWNPLALFESALGAHNDVFMEVFVLLGILCCFIAERKGFTRLRSYWPVPVFLALAILVKFTTIPVFAFFLMLLAARTLGLPGTSVRTLNWVAAIKNVLVASIIFVVIVLAFYLPFWVGHSVGAIVHSFSAPPSAYLSENSLMRVFVNLQQYDGVPAKGSLLYYLEHILAAHSFWSAVDMLSLVVAFVIGAWFMWRSPTLKSFVVGSLAALTILLLVTPWFYSWYLFWLIALAPIVLAFPVGRAAKGLITFCVVFSLLGFTAYIDASMLSHNKGLQLAPRYLLMIVPLIILAIVLWLNARTHKGQLVSAESPSTDDVQSGAGQ